jgi:hypothetical protein
MFEALVKLPQRNNMAELCTVLYIQGFNTTPAFVSVLSEMEREPECNIKK